LKMCESCKLSTDLYNVYHQNTTHLYRMEKTIKPKIKSVVKPVNAELQKSQSYIIVEIIEYIPNSVVSKTIIKKSTGNVTVMSFDKGEGLSEKISPFDTFVQIIEGKADIVIDKISHILNTGQGIIIPAHSPNLIKPNGRFKMISTVIKSGYE
jgi:quercetin dioxygenase-like cupin family protein